MNIFKKIKALLIINKSINKITEGKMKSGIKSTEFWMTVATQTGVLVTALNGVIPPTLAIIIAASATCAYTILRSLVKNSDITTLVKTETK